MRSETGAGRGRDIKTGIKGREGTRRRFSRRMLMLVLALGLVLIAGGTVTAATIDLSLSTDRSVYHLGETVIISGVASSEGRPLPGMPAAIEVRNSEDGLVNVDQVVTDANGNFNWQFNLNPAISATSVTGDYHVWAAVSGGVPSQISLTVMPLTTVAAPATNLTVGSYSSPQSVTLSSFTQGASIYYTTDGSDPSDATNSDRTLYSAPINVSTTTTLKAIALVNGVVSDVVTFTYIIAAPNRNGGSGTSGATNGSGPVSGTSGAATGSNGVTTALPEQVITGADVLGLTSSDGQVVSPVTFGPSGARAIIKADAKAALAAAGKGLVLDAGLIRITIPPTILAKFQAQQMEVTAVPVDPEEDPQLVSSLESQNLSLVSPMLEFQARQGEGEAVFTSSPLRVEISYAAHDGSLNDNMIGIYRYDPVAGWVYIRSKVDRDSKTIGVLLNHFSKYAVMASTVNFSDLEGHWAKNDILTMAARQVAKGTGTGQFEPERGVTRAEFAVLLTRMLQLQNSLNTSNFNDIKPSDWYFNDVMAAAAAGLVQGVGDVRFNPGAMITREEIAVMLARALQQEGMLPSGPITAETASFTDQANIAAWARDGVDLAVKAGLILGLPDGTFMPTRNATRAEAIVMLSRLWNTMEDSGKI